MKDFELRTFDAGWLFCEEDDDAESGRSGAWNPDGATGRKAMDVFRPPSGMYEQASQHRDEPRRRRSKSMSESVRRDGVFPSEDHSSELTFEMWIPADGAKRKWSSMGLSDLEAISPPILSAEYLRSIFESYVTDDEEEELSSSSTSTAIPNSKTVYSNNNPSALDPTTVNHHHHEIEYTPNAEKPSKFKIWKQLRNCSCLTGDGGVGGGGGGSSSSNSGSSGGGGASEKSQTNEIRDRKKLRHVRGGSWGSIFFKKVGNEVVASRPYRGYEAHGSNSSGKKKGQSCGVKE
ncbi:hypothetical protein BSKO_11808 [Bryopsis sp. KO-2023]|nr:hypothetical protein BSKO_11808 [Bryopsis sp. KO-2023]